MNVPYNSLGLDKTFDALAHSKRRGIIHDLSLSPATISRLADNHNLSLPAIHKHVRVLENAQLIQRKKVGRTNFIALKPDSINLAQTWIMQYKTEWAHGNASLTNYIARMQE
jgi:DNA-binding transcriptional ArsR family regulator